MLVIGGFFKFSQMFYIGSDKLNFYDKLYDIINKFISAFPKSGNS